MTPMTKDTLLDLDQLEAVAKAATPGPWDITFDSCASCGGEWDIYDIPGGAHAKFAREEDARHIATFDPPTVLALIAKQRELVEALEGLLATKAAGFNSPEVSAARAALSKLERADVG